MAPESTRSPSLRQFASINQFCFGADIGVFSIQSRGGLSRTGHRSIRAAKQAGESSNEQANSIGVVCPHYIHVPSLHFHSLATFHCPAHPFCMHLTIRDRLQPACAQALLPLVLLFQGAHRLSFSLSHHASFEEGEDLRRRPRTAWTKRQGDWMMVRGPGCSHDEIWKGMHEVSCGTLVAWLVQNFLRFEAIVFGACLGVLGQMRLEGSCHE